jgi:hypothetical protein
VTKKKTKTEAPPPMVPGRLVYKGEFDQPVGRLVLHVLAYKNETVDFRFTWTERDRNTRTHRIKYTYREFLATGAEGAAIGIAGKIVHDPKFVNSRDDNKVAGWCALFPDREFVLDLVEARAQRMMDLLNLLESWETRPVSFPEVSP